MSRPTLSLLNVTPGQAGWDATITTNFAAMNTFLTGQPIPLPVYTIASGPSHIPSAGANEKCICFVSDPASGKSQLVFSDGTNWRYTDNSVAV